MTQVSVGTDVESPKDLPDVQPIPVPPVPEPTHWFDLVWTLVRTEFKVRYHGTIGGSRGPSRNRWPCSCC